MACWASSSALRFGAGLPASCAPAPGAHSPRPAPVQSCNLNWMRRSTFTSVSTTATSKPPQSCCRHKVREVAARRGPWESGWVKVFKRSCRWLRSRGVRSLARRLAGLCARCDEASAIVTPNGCYLEQARRLLQYFIVCTLVIDLCHTDLSKPRCLLDMHACWPAKCKCCQEQARITSSCARAALGAARAAAAARCPLMHVGRLCAGVPARFVCGPPSLLGGDGCRVRSLLRLSPHTHCNLPAT